MASILPLPQLTSTNYSNWRFRVETLLEKEGVKGTLDVTEEELLAMSTTAKETHIKNEIKAKYLIVQCTSDKYTEYVKDAKRAKEMLSSLSNIFERKSTFSKLFVMKKLIKLKCTSEDLQEHFMQVETLLRELEAAGAKLDESDKVCYLLLTMPEKYSVVITAIETVTTDITLSFVKSRLLDAELKFKDSQPETDSNKNCSFSAKKQFVPGKCFQCGEHGHYCKDCPQKNKKPTDGYGHYTRRGRGRNYGRGWRKQVHTTVREENNKKGDEKEISFVAETITAGMIETNSCESRIDFVLDSGATDHLLTEDVLKHMTDIEDLPEKVLIRVANGNALTAFKKGKLTLKYGEIDIVLNALVVPNLTHNLLSVKKINEKGNHVVFEKVKYGEIDIVLNALVVPNLTHNLLSVKKINEKGNHVVFEKAKATIRSSGNTCIECISKGNLYIVSFAVKEEKCNITISGDVWHKRLGHLSEEYMKKMNLPTPTTTCSPCRQGKATRLPFQKVKLPRSKCIGELLHIGGPIRTSTYRK
ncbi:GAG-pre-integrase domain [Popillia japonica]|uniref:GAG-pre-integrase domain n=1 Tax=Popillia japonica TaxID=7064 RepID=A0AAW1IDN5_POPJA